MRRIVAAFDVDFDQWKALTVALLKLDFRLSSLGRSQFGAVSSAAGALAFHVAFYTLFGLFMAVVAWFSRDLFLVGTLMTTYTIFVVGTAVLLDHNSAIASPSDYAVLGFRPISSRTYFAVRLTNVFVYATALTTLAVWLPVVSLFLRHGLAIGVAGLVAFYACSASTTLAILLGYAWMLRVVAPDAIQRALSYLQLVMSFFVYGAYFLISPVVARSVVTSLTLPKTPWLLLYPGTWFATYLELAAGKTGPLEIIPAAASAVALVVLASRLGGRLSLDYSERLGAMTAAAASKAGSHGRPKPGLWFTTGEARAVALLVRSQFRNDQKFRLGVLGILPLTVLYLLMGLRDGTIGDPFVYDRQRQGFSVVSMAVMMFPTILKVHLTRSDAFRASWIFFVCPTDRIKIVRSAKNVLVAFFLVPYLLFVAALLTYLLGNVVHVLVHVALMGLLSHLMLQVAVLAEPVLPFSLPIQKGRSSAAFLGLIAATTTISMFVQMVSASLYRSTIATLATFIVIPLAGGVVDWLTRARVERETKSLEFEG